MTIKEIRKKTGLSQKEFGLLMGLLQNNVSRIEKGDREETVQQIAMIRIINFLHNEKLLEKYINQTFTKEKEK